MKSGRKPAHEAVDRLIELASGPKPETKPALVLEEPRESDQNTMWKALLQLKALLPYASKLLPLLEIAGLSLPQNGGMSKEVRESVAAIQAGQRDLRAAVQDQTAALQGHTLEIKQLEEEIARLRDISERAEAEQAALAASVKSNRKLILTAVSILTILLIALLVMVGILLAHKVR